MDIFENFQKINEQEDLYRSDVKLSVHVNPSPGLEDVVDVESPNSISLTYDIQIEYRSWGIKDINVFLRGVVEFDAVFIKTLPNEEEREEIVPVKVDFSTLEPRIDWIEGSGIAPAELHVVLGEGNEVVEVEVDFYYWKP